MMHRSKDSGNGNGSGNDGDADATPTVQTAMAAPSPLSPPATLPENEPHAQPIAASRGELAEQIEALEGALQYMGSLHPQREAMRQRLAGLLDLLGRLDRSAQGIRADAL